MYSVEGTEHGIYFHSSGGHSFQEHITEFGT